MSVSIDGTGSLIGVDQGLNIVGLTTLTGGIILDDSISHIGDTDTKIRFPAADTFTIETGGSERLRITSTGKCEVYKGTSATGKTSGSEAFTVGNGAGNKRFSVYPDGSTVIGGQGIIGNYNILLQNDGQSYFGARMKIGTTTEGEANADDLTIATSAHTGMTIRSGTANRGNIYFSDGTSGDAEYRGYITYDHDGDKFSFATANYTRIKILGDGTIASGNLSSTPGTVAAGSIIQSATNAGFFSNGIDGKFGTSSNHPLYFQTNGITKAAITAAGAFSVGTTSPQQPNLASIHVHSTANDDCRIAITTPSKPDGRIGYFGLSNKFGMDVYNGFEVRDVGSSYATRFAINSTGVVTFGGQSYASATKSGGVNVSSSCYFDITGSNHVFVKIMIKVGYTGNSNYQMHAQYDYVTCNYSTSGATATRTDILQVEAANAQFNYSDISISRPSNRTVRVTYAPSSGAGTHHPILYVSGVFDSITVS